MLPRRSLRLRQLNSRPASTAIASSSLSSSSTNATSKSIRSATQKRARTEADASVDDVAIQPKLKKMKQNNDINAPFLLLPTEVLERIFTKVDDFGLLNLTDTCTRFESIALAVASKRYANQHFKISRYWRLFSIGLNFQAVSFTVQL